MREFLRTSLWCLFVALALNLAFTHGQPLLHPADEAEALEKIPWLQVTTFNRGSARMEPRQTVIRTKVKPVVNEIWLGHWEITFQPE